MRDTEANLEANIAATQAELIRKEELKELRTARQNEARFRLFMESLEANMARMPAFAGPMPKMADSKEHDEETAVLVLSDVHVGKWVDPTEVGGTFRYGIPLFKKRLDNLKRRFDSIIDIHRRAIPIKTLYVLMLGDLVEGSDMRPSQRIRIDATIGAQTLIFVQHMAPLLAGFAREFDEVRVIVVGGNHGRVGKAGENLPVDNFDVMAGHFLETSLQNVENVSVHVSHKPYELARIGGLEMYMAHGENTGGGGGFAGVPAFSIARSAARDTALHRRLFDAYVIGHFHTAQDMEINGTPILVNGCWDGGDNYSVNRLKVASIPAQWLFGVGKRGLTWRYRLHVAEPKRDPTPLFDFDEEAAS